MGNPITLADFKIGGDSISIELIDTTVTVKWPSDPLSVSEKRFPQIAADITRVVSSAAMELSRHKAGLRS